MSEQEDGGHGYQFTRLGTTYKVHTECAEGSLTRIVVEESPAQTEQESES